jgi:phosphoenolpyruvate-protein phosphotransferase (PTS system enzyme I)
MAMREFKGLSINSGKVAAPACLYSSTMHKAAEEYEIAESEIEKELVRFENALKESTEELESISSNVARRVGSVESEIFLAQKHIMNDEGIVRQIRENIRKNKKNVEAVIYEVYRAFEEKFKAMENLYLRERVADISEIRRRLIDNLKKRKPGFICEGQEHCQRGANRIIVAEDFTADMMVHMNFESVRGFVTEHGGVSSHAAIIARSLGLPAVTGIHGITEFVKCGDRILIDGDRGVVYLEPTDDIVNAVMASGQAEPGVKRVMATPPGMEVLANASILEDVRQARLFRADGIGLYRTEILFIKADRLLSEEEQYEQYRSVAEEMGNRTVTFRLLDVGGDKPLPFLRIQKELNPYLGWRGARFLLGNPDIFATQLRALAKLTKKKKLRILIPMVIDENQVKTMVKVIREVGGQAGMEWDNVELGAMFEVPSACLQAAGIFKHVDFASIGSNDLIQYLFAVDRNNEQVSADYNPEHPVLWALLRELAIASEESKKGLSICGEMAGREGMATKLLDAGIRSLSVSPRLIPQVRSEMKQYHESMTDSGRPAGKTVARKTLVKKQAIS